MLIKQLTKRVNLIKTPTELKYLYSMPKKNISFNILKIFGTRLFGTLLTKIFVRNKSKQKQIRWKLFYKNALKELNKKYDVAIAYMEGEPLYYVIDKINANRKIGWIHNDYSKIEYDSKFDKEYFEKFDKIVTVSEECKQVLNCIFGESDKFIYLPNLSSSKKIHELAETGEAYEYNQYLEKKILLSIGRLSKQKAFERVIEASKDLKEHKYEFIWFIIGEGKERKKLEKLIIDNKVEDCVILLGQKENPYVYIKNCDIFVQTSNFEGKSVVLDEAKILAKPIVSTNYDTIKDQIQDKEEGLICEMNVKDIVNKIEILLNDGNMYNEIKNYLEKNEYGNEHLISEYEKIIG